MPVNDYIIDQMESIESIRQAQDKREILDRRRNGECGAVLGNITALLYVKRWAAFARKTCISRPIMNETDFLSIVKKAWADYGSPQRLASVEDISARVSTNHV